MTGFGRLAVTPKIYRAVFLVCVTHTLKFLSELIRKIIIPGQCRIEIRFVQVDGLFPAANNNSRQGLLVAYVRVWVGEYARTGAIENVFSR